MLPLRPDPHQIVPDEMVWSKPPDDNDTQAVKGRYCPGQDFSHG